MGNITEFVLWKKNLRKSKKFWEQKEWIKEGRCMGKSIKELHPYHVTRQEWGRKRGTSTSEQKRLKTRNPNLRIKEA